MYNNGTKLYYNKLNGNVLYIQLDRVSSVKQSTLDEDYVIISEINCIDKKQLGLIEFDFGKFDEFTKGCEVAGINLENEQLILEPKKEIEIKVDKTWEQILEDKISILELGLANAEYSLMMGGLL